MSMSAAEGDYREVLALRRAIYGKGDATRADLEILIARGRQGGADPEFCNLIAEVATDVLVRQVDPAGYPKNRIWPVPVWRRIGHFQWDDPGSIAHRRSPHR
jgi:hypothetical protein